MIWLIASVDVPFHTGGGMEGKKVNHRIKRVQSGETHVLGCGGKDAKTAPKGAVVCRRFTGTSGKIHIYMWLEYGFTVTFNEEHYHNDLRQKA